jgi:hypothetical protein
MQAMVVWFESTDLWDTEAVYDLKLQVYTGTTDGKRKSFKK